MPTVVYVWNNSPDDVGHVSIQVNDIYMSFWPKSAAKAKKDIKIGQTHDAVFPKGYKVDCKLEGREADRTLELHKLDEQQMIDYWKKFKDNSSRYNMLKSNCSTVIASVLEFGSNIPPNHSPKININDYIDNYSMRWLLKLRFLGNHIHMWTPNAVMVYAQQINRERRV